MSTAWIFLRHGRFHPQHNSGRLVSVMPLSMEQPLWWIKERRASLRREAAIEPIAQATELLGIDDPEMEVNFDEEFADLESEFA